MSSSAHWTGGGTLDDLAERVIGQVHECIGCNDCMLACPLDETSIVTIAALNEAVMAPSVESETVRAFVTACTQCQQCVPVCPADLSRADMVLFNKLKVADVAEDRVLLAQIGSRVGPSEWSLDALCQHLVRTPMLRTIEAPTLRRMILASTLHWLSAGEVLTAEESFSDRLYIVVRGKLAQTARLEDGARVELLALGAGNFVGEMAALADRREPYGLMARTAAEVLAVPKATVHELRRTSAAFRAVLESAARERALEAYAARSAMLSALPEAAREAFVARGAMRMVAAGEVLVRQGGGLGAFTIVLSGFLRVATRRTGERERTLSYLREGDDFGAIFGLHGDGYTSDVAISAVSRASLLEIPLAALRAVLKQHPEAQAELVRRATEELAVATRTTGAAGKAAKASPPAQTSGRDLMGTSNYGLNLSAMLDKGVLSGHEVLAIDLRRCTDCNNCVDACGRRHGTPRLERRGLQLDHMLFPSACRHCDDPVCLLCSVNGIVRKPGGEIAIVESNCIGCGSCADRCPYGNITMQPRTPPARSGIRSRFADLLAPSHAAGQGAWSEGVFGRFVDWLRGAPTTSTDEGPPVAVKCDLCEGYDDQACVKACPTGAAFRFDPKLVFGDKRVAAMGGRDEGT